jgi:integrase/recombinase XerD
VAHPSVSTGVLFEERA